MGDVNWIPVLVAAIGAGGLSAFAREIVDVVTKVRNGVSARESKRKNDIIAQRDRAVVRAEAAEARTDREREARRLVEAHAARLEIALIRAGGDPPAWPDIDDTTDPVRKKETPDG